MPLKQPKKTKCKLNSHCSNSNLKAKWSKRPVENLITVKEWRGDWDNVGTVFSHAFKERDTQGSVDAAASSGRLEMCQVGHVGPISTRPGPRAGVTMTSASFAQHRAARAVTVEPNSL